MPLFEQKKIAPGLHWVAIPSRSLYIQCGCPADSVKHLIKAGLIRQENGCETGPNALLLSDLTIQNGQLANLAEFSILQMFYRQGMMIPGSPGYTGQKPIMIGHPEPLAAQLDYVFRGNYGLTREELNAHAASEEEAERLWRIKLSFAFGKIKPMDELFEQRPLESGSLEIAKGVFVRRVRTNVFEFSCDGETIELDLMLGVHESYQPTYKLPFQQIRPEFFSVIHSGEGDGWDVNRPPMASIICYGPEVYLIDAGPYISHSLRALGLSLNSVRGIFQTHAHDDHFAGLSELMRGDRKLEFYATPAVRQSVELKLQALLNVELPVLETFFTVIDLKPEMWNDIEGLEVLPAMSPHPVETSIFKFRAMGPDGYKTYHHLADIASFGVLQNMLEADPSKPGLSPETYARVMDTYLEPADLKKIDAGGGMIHGQAADFAQDSSGLIVYSHSSRQIQAERGIQVKFGEADHLIKGQLSYRHELAARALHHHFPSIPFGAFYDLLNHEILELQPGLAIASLARDAQDVFLVLSGIVGGGKNAPRVEYGAGYFINDGFDTDLKGLKTRSYVELLRIPARSFRAFLVRNQLLDGYSQAHQRRKILAESELFSPVRHSPLLLKLARSLESFKIVKGKSIKAFAGHYVFLLTAGRIHLTQGTYVEELLPGGFCYEDNFFMRQAPFHLDLIAQEDSEGLLVPTALIKDIPAIEWRLLETYMRRSQALRQVKKKGGSAA